MRSANKPFPLFSEMRVCTRETQSSSKFFSFFIVLFFLLLLLLLFSVSLRHTKVHPEGQPLPETSCSFAQALCQCSGIWNFFLVCLGIYVPHDRVYQHLGTRKTTRCWLLCYLLTTQSSISILFENLKKVGWREPFSFGPSSFNLFCFI